MPKKDELFENGNSPADENEEYDPEIYTLTDEEGNELHFALLGSLENEGNEYKALIPVDENGEDIFETIEDDEEFDRIADIFDDEFADIFYDED